MAHELSTYGPIMPSLDYFLEIHGFGMSFNAFADATRTTPIGNSLLLSLPTNNQSREVQVSTRAPESNEPESELEFSPIQDLGNPISLMEPRITRTISVLSSDARQVITFALSQHERLLSMAYFTPRRRQITHFRDVVVNCLQASSITRCAAFLGARIVQSRLEGTASDYSTSLSKSVERFEQKLLVASQTAAAPKEVQDRLNGFLEVALLKMVLTNRLLAYKLLRSAAPKFLAIVLTDATLWPDPCGPPAVSLAHVISSTRYVLSHFVLVDTSCAMAYGLPQIVEYDTSVPVIDHGDNLHPVQHIHGCPPELQICLADINMRCSRGYISHDWHLIEQRLLSYKPYLNHTEDVESWKVVARLAVVESWRQVLLVYLYMAVCGVASDDPRVQLAVRQIFQLLKTVPRQDPPKLYANFMIQYLIAGACTRSEKQRAYIRQRLLDPYECQLWLLPGSEFVPVLDHLWHGAAANGQAFKWSDYIFSRQTALPVPI